MQKKSLLVALFCGALCLTGCLKNEESDSVRQVRLGKAAELNSLAKLNDAKAQAELIYANAEATLKTAQAALLNAQAETERIRAELLKVQVKLAEVKVEEEKVVLAQMQAELEVALARAEADKQRWANILNNLIADAEIQAIENAKALLEAQAEMEEYILTLADEKATAAKEASYKYFAALAEVQDFQNQQLVVKATKALVEAGAVVVRDVIYSEIEHVNAQIAENNDKIAFLKAHQNMTPEEAEEMLKQANLFLSQLYADYQDILSVKEAADEALAEHIATNQSVYTERWRPFTSYLRSIGSYRDRIDEVEGYSPVRYTVYDYVDEDGNVITIPLFREEQTITNFEFFPGAVDGIYNPLRSAIIRNTKYIAAEIYTENIDVALDDQLAKIDAQIKAQKEIAKDNIDGAVKNSQERVDYYTERLAFEKEYLDTRRPVVEDAEKAFAEALLAWDKALKSENKAWQDYSNYMILTYDISRDYFENVYYAKEDKDKAESDYAVAKKAYDDEMAKKPTDEDYFNARLATAQAVAAKAAADKVYADGKTAEDLATASVAYRIEDNKPAGTAVDAEAQAQSDYDTAYANWEDAYLAYIADPTDTDKAAAEATAKATLNTKNIELAGEQAKLALAKKAYEDAKNADDVAKAKVTAAAEVVLNAQKEEAKKNPDTWVADAEIVEAEKFAKGALTTKKGILEDAEKDLAAAFKALDQKGVKYEEDPTFQAKYEAYLKASEANTGLGMYDGKAREAFDALEKLYYTVYQNKDGYWYNYLDCAYDLDPLATYVYWYTTDAEGNYIPYRWPVGGYKTVYNEETGEYEDVIDETGSDSFWKAYHEQIIANAPEDLEKQYKAIEKSFAGDKAEIEKVREYVKSFEQYKSAYVAVVDKTQELSEAAVDAKKVAIAAKWEIDEAKAEYDALTEISLGGVYVYDPTDPAADAEGFVFIDAATEIANLEGEGNILSGAVQALIGVLSNIDAPSIAGVIEGIAEYHAQGKSNVELKAIEAILKRVLKYGKIGLELVVEALDEQIDILDEKIEIYTKIAEIYKGVMNANLGIEPNGGETPSTDEE